MNSSISPEQAKTQVKAAIETVSAVGDAIRELGSVPSGHLYAQVSGHLDLQTYNKIIRILKNADLVKEENFLLTWIGPKI